MKKWLLWLAFLILAACTTVQTLDVRATDLENRVCGQSPCVATDPAPPPEPFGVPSAIAAMAPGSWLAYGAPWEEAAPAERLCNRGFGAVIGAWNGWARDGLRYIYVAASGGHGDGCDNGVYRYDIQAGRAEMFVPHVELNADLDLGFPFVADENGAQILPRSSHTYFGQYLEKPWLYLVIGSAYHNGKSDGQVWRFHVIEKRWERLPDRLRSNGKLVGSLGALVVKTPEGTVIAGNWMICDIDLVMGSHECQKTLYFAVSSSIVWDPKRGGIWHVKRKGHKVRFLRRVDGAWRVEDSLSGVMPDDVAVGIATNPGICVVPDGTILVWSGSSDLYRWDGATWSVISAPGGPPITDRRAIESKWSWDDEAQVCIGGSRITDGLWIYKPASSPGPAPVPELEPKPKPKPEPEPKPQPDPLPEPEPAPVDLKAKYSIDRDNLPSIGGVAVQVLAWEPAPWDQPIERLPGAPDYDAICGGDWTELNYRTNADLAGSKRQTRALARAAGGKINVRIFLHTLKNAAGSIVAYTEHFKGRGVRCLEIIGVPDDGHKPQMRGNIGFENGRGLIVRGLIMAETGHACINPKGSVKLRTQPAFVVIHDSEFYACAGHTHFFGGSNHYYPPTYLEQIGNVIAYAKSHAQYNKASIGRFVYKSNVCFAAGWGHCLKNLAHSSLIEGNVISNAGLDGQVTTAPDPRVFGERLYEGGMHALDLYGCTETVVRGNTFIYRTTSNIRQIMAYRPRGGMGGCNKGRRLSEDSWELLLPTDPTYQDPAFWAEAAAAVALFDEGFEAARASDLLFTHKVENNRFIVLLAYRPDKIGISNVKVLRPRSLRPINKSTIRKALRLESVALVESCQGDVECFLAGASVALKYAYNHITPKWQRLMVKRGKLQSKIPILAPEGWVERHAIYWGAQEGWACDAEGATCVPWNVPVPRVPVENWGYDTVKQGSPPRVIVGE